MADIKMLILDVDGVMTDGGIYSGHTLAGAFHMKKFHARDGRGIIDLSRTGFPIRIISGSLNSEILDSRAKILGIEKVAYGVEDKLRVLKEWVAEANISLQQVAFIGDDMNDYELMKEVGLPACPADAHEKIKMIAKIVLTKKGGKGAVREFIDMHWGDQIYPIT